MHTEAKPAAMDRFLLFFCIQILFYSSSIAEEDALIVNTANGELRGRFEDVLNGVSIRQFFGIPYAQPPIGELRFAQPKPAASWEDVRDAGEFGPICPQVPMEEMFKAMNMSVGETGEEMLQSEDCLSLNVYTPSKTTPTNKLAVMVWIHGGGFVASAGRSYNPSLLVALHNVIVVTINYRLGVLGFFNIPGTDVKGNYGLYDQILSLKWVQQNIAAFGGNPDQVTIFGESAGGMSVSSLLISPLSKGLFHHVIEQSGSSLSGYSCSKVSSTKGLEVFSKAISCDDKDDKLLDCVREKSFKDIIAGQNNLTATMQMVGPEFLTKPIVDGEFLPDDPKILLKNGQVNKADVMLGFTADEGSFFVMFLTSASTAPKNEELLRNIVQQYLHAFGSHSQLSEDAVMREYLDRNDLNNTDKIRQTAIDVLSDGFALAPAVDEANLLAKAGIPVYLYVMDHHPHASRFPNWLGAYHGIDLPYFLGAPLKKDIIGKDISWLLPGNYSALEEGFSKYVMQMWTNFAKYGDPNGADHMPVMWPQYNHEHAHLRLSTNPKIQRGLRERKVEFWTEFFPKLTESQSEASDSKAKEGEKQKEEL